MWNSLSMVIYANLFEITKMLLSFISRPILIVIALFGRAELRTLNFYTEFWNFVVIIMTIYANLVTKTKKYVRKPSSFQNASSSFLNRFWFWLFDMIGLGGGFKTPTHNAKFYGNLCKFYSKSQKMLLLHFSTDFVSDYLIW